MGDDIKANDEYRANNIACHLYDKCKLLYSKTKMASDTKWLFRYGFQMKENNVKYRQLHHFTLNL